jgi:hypothetical protein
MTQGLTLFETIPDLTLHLQGLGEEVEGLLVVAHAFVAVADQAQSNRLTKSIAILLVKSQSLLVDGKGCSGSVPEVEIASP